MNESLPRSILDRVVANQALQVGFNGGSWQFSARDGYDVRPASYSEGGCFDERAGGDGRPTSQTPSVAAS